MAIRVYTALEENMRLKEDIQSSIRELTRLFGYHPQYFSDYRLIFDTTESRITLSHPRWRDKAYFRLYSYPGSGMLRLELEETADSYMTGEVYAHYHTEMMDFLYSRFYGRFYLVEETRFEDRRPNIDDIHARKLRELGGSPRDSYLLM